ncbi:MAG: hypothetical protein K0T99_02160 [Alphaproteobacteria bacterium]|nr:hypothetical protein [Alphaproteobacteria bacterium]
MGRQLKPKTKKQRQAEKKKAAQAAVEEEGEAQAPEAQSSEAAPAAVETPTSAEEEKEKAIEEDKSIQISTIVASVDFMGDYSRISELKLKSTVDEDTVASEAEVPSEPAVKAAAPVEEAESAVAAAAALTEDQKAELGKKMAIIEALSEHSTMYVNLEDGPFASVFCDKSSLEVKWAEEAEAEAAASALASALSYARICDSANNETLDEEDDS